MGILSSILEDSFETNDESLNTWDDDQEYVDDIDVNESAAMFIDEMDDGSGFDGFGVDKINRPSGHGLSVGVSAQDAFANATDGGLDCSIDLSYHDAFDESDGSGFEKDAFLFSEADECTPVDPNTIPHYNSEDDQYSPSMDNEISMDGVDLAELVDDDTVTESATGWDDLY